MDPVAQITMADILSSLGNIVTSVAGYVTTWVSALVSNPLILMFILIPLVGIGIGIVRRLLNVN